MALQIRRGTDADRQGITPKAGEPIFTTDTKKLYVGDGTTAGGVAVDTTAGLNDLIEDTTPQLGGNLDLNNKNITGTGNINITGEVSATSIDLRGSIFADDSTLLVDGVSGKIVGPVEANVTGDVTGNVTGNLTGNATGNHSGTFSGVMNGSVFGEDSTVLVDGINNIITAPVSTTGRGLFGDIAINSTGASISHTNEAANNMVITMANELGTIILNRKTQLGSTQNDIDGELVIRSNTAEHNNISALGSYDGADQHLITIGRSRGTKASPTTVQNGDGLGTFLITGYNGVGYRVAGGIRAVANDTPASLYIPSDVEIFVANTSGGGDSALTVKYGTKTTEFKGAAKLQSYASSERDGISAENGMMIYNSDTDKVQAYAGGAWVDLH